MKNKDLMMIKLSNFIGCYFKDKNDVNGNPVYRYFIYKIYKDNEVTHTLEKGKTKTSNIKTFINDVLETYKDIEESRG